MVAELWDFDHVPPVESLESVIVSFIRTITS